jgi:hypothetical protein
VNDQQPRDEDAERLRPVLPARVIGNHHDNAGAA